MKIQFTLIALSSISLLSANQYDQRYGYQSASCPSCNTGGYYQGQSYNTDSYNQNQPSNGNGYYQGQQNNNHYNQRNDQSPQQNRQYNSQQQAPRNPIQPNVQNQSNVQNQPNSKQQNNPPKIQEPATVDDQPIKQDEKIKKIVSDHDISNNIREALKSSWLSRGFQDVSFDVYNGDVNLKGTVETIEEKNKVDDIVRKIEGIHEVNNQITIIKKTVNDKPIKK